MAETMDITENSMFNTRKGKKEEGILLLFIS